jgi:hypothetical protein
MLCHLDPSISDVEFVVNFHDYNKVLRDRKPTTSKNKA